MQDILTHSKFRVERNSRRIDQIRLNEDHVGSALRGDLLKFSNQRCCYALPSVCGCDRQIVNVDFASFLLELQ